MEIQRKKLIENWVFKLNRALKEGEYKFNHQKDLMTDELDCDECEEVFNAIDS